MRPFVIDIDMIRSLKNLAEYAEKNPFTMDDLLDMMNKELGVAGDFTNHTVILPFGYKIVLSVEQQIPGNIRHLSVSVDGIGKVPHPEVIRTIMTYTGFITEIERCKVYMEDLPDGGQAVNILELMSN